MDTKQAKFFLHDLITHLEEGGPLIFQSLIGSGTRVSS
jgi:hypothetical protein